MASHDGHHPPTSSLYVISATDLTPPSIDFASGAAELFADDFADGVAGEAATREEAGEAAAGGGGIFAGAGLPARGGGAGQVHLRGSLALHHPGDGVARGV